MKRVFIYGSCASRDAFELDINGQFEVIDYYARSSIASALSDKPAKDFYSYKLKSRFQQRQVSRDFAKTLPDALSKDFDILLMDFVDERFGLFQFSDGSLVTVSAELNSLKIFSQNLGRRIDPAGSEKMRMWQRGWLRMVEHLSEKEQLSAVRVNCVYWASTGLPVHESIRDTINENLDRMYDYCRLHLSPAQFLNYDQELMIADPEHKWGYAPFHYTKALYEETLMQLKSL
jgi:hypothetical protein